MRLLIAQCEVDYSGRLSAHLPKAMRLIMVKADGSVSIHADDRAYKPLNWMSAPCVMTTSETETGELWEINNKSGDTLQIAIGEIFADSTFELGIDPGLEKDGVEAHLQALLAQNPTTFGIDWTLVQREYFTPIGPVDLLFRDGSGQYVAVEVKRRGEIDGVEQLTRYLELMNADPQLAPVRGVFAAQQIKPQARVLAGTRDISCLLVDYDALRGMDNPEERLF